jgi:hypothetical protein
MGRHCRIEWFALIPDTLPIGNRGQQSVIKPNKSNPMQAIHTKYLPATNTRGSRIKATCERGSITIPYPHELSGDECHREAVRQLVARFCAEDFKSYQTPIESNPWNRWNRSFATGCLPDGSFAHVFTV